MEEFHSEVLRHFRWYEKIIAQQSYVNVKNNIFNDITYLDNSKIPHEGS